MKGVSSFIKYSLTVLIGFLILTFFVALINNYYKQVSESNLKEGLKEVALQTANAITQLYDVAKKTNARPENSSSITISSMNLNYPDNINGKSFEVDLVSSPGIWNLVMNITINGKNVTIMKETNSGSKVIVKTIQKPFVEYEYELPNMPLILEGKFKSGGNSTLKLVRFNFNGTINDCIILGDSSIIVGVTNIR